MQIGIFHRPEKRFSCLSSLWVIFFILLAIAQSAHGQAVKILPLGDSYTEGVRAHVSYRYDLWFDLIEAGFDVDFVGGKSNTFDSPDLDLYPKYMTTFDRDHQGQAGISTDALVQVAKVASVTYQPDIVLLWAGSPDVGRLGLNGVTTANFGIRDTIEGIRKFVPGVTILLALNPPFINGEFTGAEYMETLNDVITTIASDLNTPESPIILVDLHTGFDTGSMLQDDLSHQNRVGETFVAGNWFEALEKIIPDIVPISGFSINAGLNDAWYNPLTDGQGFFVTVFPDIKKVFLAWFTFDTELPPMNATANLGYAGHRWLTAIGSYVDNEVVMNISITTDGIFDNDAEVQNTDPPGSDGTIILTFDNCNSATVEYDIPSINRQGIVPIQRIANDNIVLCEALSAE